MLCSRPFFILLIATLLFSSCSSIFNFEKRKYRPGFHFDGNSSSHIPEEKLEVKEFTASMQEDASIITGSTMETVLQDSTRVDSVRVLEISPKVGAEIDKSEKVTYHLFPFFKTDDFVSAYFIQRSDSSILLVGNMMDGTRKQVPYTKAQFVQTQRDNFKMEVRVPGVFQDSKTSDSNKEEEECVNAKRLSILGLICLLLGILALGTVILAAVFVVTGLILHCIVLSKARNIFKRHPKGSDFPGAKKLESARIISLVSLILLLLVFIIILILLFAFALWQFIF